MSRASIHLNGNFSDARDLRLDRWRLQVEQIGNKHIANHHGENWNLSVGTQLEIETSGAARENA